MPFIQGAGATVGFAGSVARAFPANNTAGNLLIAGVASGYGGSPWDSFSDTQGNTWALSHIAGGGDCVISVGYALNCRAGANTVTGQGAGMTSGRSIAVAEYSLVKLTAALDRVTQNNGFGTAISSGATATTTQADELLIGFVAGGNFSCGPFTAGSSFTGRTDVAGSTFDAAQMDRFVAALGSYTFTATGAGASNWVAAIATFKLASLGVLDRQTFRGIGRGLARGMQ
jgi:hypothetical protein